MATGPAELLDCVVVGGGPAGLTAAIHLGRYHLSVVMVDEGRSRAAQIPLTRNHAGFPDGVSGEELLVRMRQQALHYGVRALKGRVTKLSRHGAHFDATIGGEVLSARSVLLATGVINRRPPMIDKETHDRGLARGLLRYCPVCDGYEVTDQRIAVFGSGERALAEARFLRSFSRDVTVVADDPHFAWTAHQRAELAAAGVTLISMIHSLTVAEAGIVVETLVGRHIFDTLYPALGSTINSQLARDAGADVSDEGCLMVDAHQRTNVPGLYAAGDVVLGLDQISHAMGEGGVAATTMRNDLALMTPLFR
ncbi:NAD(P)/FAD-dependent oxidoreductase [Novosphingobium sp. TCA1]|uniref:NAD(P)/FAD-dependent oxidoreductase n=1 Tax=Novosphingobium sp. TCA1 TaxID=2682474 RepID=UPI001309B072|nr:NAD(P)/FAD-dependent oxidoreductase [Novosphingobium sp. TCA1]GFE76939.1 thioredoxin-disulfide reductase [Novosphingobium sp. TCA1]